MMKRVILSVVAAALILALGAGVEAAPKSGSPKGSNSYASKGSFHDFHNYHLTHGTKFEDGYFYKGKEHRHWTYRYWYSKYGCYSYYCPSTSCWYYYYPREDCYYPISYITSATPVAEPAPVGVPTGVTQIVNVTNNSPSATTVGGGAAGPAGVPVPAPNAAAPNSLLKPNSASQKSPSPPGS